MEVPAHRLDSLAEKEVVDLNAIDLVWMDAQGHEAHILAGAESLMTMDIPILTEYWPYGLRRAGALDRFHSLVARRAWRVRGFAHREARGNAGLPGHGDRRSRKAICVRGVRRLRITYGSAAVALSNGCLDREVVPQRGDEVEAPRVWVRFCRSPRRTFLHCAVFLRSAGCKSWGRSPAPPSPARCSRDDRRLGRHPVPERVGDIATCVIKARRSMERAGLAAR